MKWISIFAAAICVHRADAQQSLARLDPPIAAEIDKLIHTAEVEHLPTASLRAKVDEGVGKGATGPRILDVVRSYFAALRIANTALGAADSIDVDAGAAAVRAGASIPLLTAIRDRRAAGHAATALVVFVDLVRRGISNPAAQDGIIALLDAGRTDAQLLSMQARLARETTDGRDPTAMFRAMTAVPPNRGIAEPHAAGAKPSTPSAQRPQ